MRPNTFDAKTLRPCWPSARTVPPQYQRRDPPDFSEGTHPISGGPLRFLSAATNDATLANWEEPVSWPKKGSAFVCKLKSKPCPSRGTQFAGLPGYYGFRAGPCGSFWRPPQNRPGRAAGGW